MGQCTCVVRRASTSGAWLGQERVDSEIKAAYDHSQAVVNMAAQRVAAEDALYTEQEVRASVSGHVATLVLPQRAHCVSVCQAMRSRTDEGASKYLQAIVKKSEVLGEMQAERGVLKLDVEEHLPCVLRVVSWCLPVSLGNMVLHNAAQVLDGAVDGVHQVARWHCTHAWVACRSKGGSITASPLPPTSTSHALHAAEQGVLQEMVDFFTRDGKTEVLPELREMEANINAWPPSKFKRVMDAIKQHAHQLELARPSAYTTAYAWCFGA